MRKMIRLALMIAVLTAAFAGPCTAGGTMKPETQSAAYDYLVLVNRTHQLPEDWAENVILKEAVNIYGETYRVEEKALAGFLALREELLAEGIDIELDSAARTVAEQQMRWDDWIIRFGEDYVKTYVAVPGYSEHHTGLAIDICLDKDGTRIADNAAMIAEREIFAEVHERLADHGFILRYPEGKEEITGYGYEPWHFRYIHDPEIAREIMDKGITLEEYLGEAPAEAIADAEELPADAAETDAVRIDYGASAIYSQKDMDAAIALIRTEFAAWTGCELHTIQYASDECCTEENLRWMNDLGGDRNYTQCIEFVSEFHSPVEESGAWEPDEEYTGWQWWLARSEGGNWELLTWGY